MRKIIFVLVTIILASACSEKDNGINPPETIPDARYRLTFNATWSAQTHPNEFPPGPHFSGLIGMTHNNNSMLFSEGQVASDGIKDMAELGSKSPLEDEIQSIITNGIGQYLISGGGVSPSPGEVSIEFDITSSHSLVSVVSMIAPSPDWFIAISNINLIENNEWVASKTINVDVYDSGTDSGPTFLSQDDPTVPRVSIFEITTPPLAVNNFVASMGSITFTKVE